MHINREHSSVLAFAQSPGAQTVRRALSNRYADVTSSTSNESDTTENMSIPREQAAPLLDVIAMVNPSTWLLPKEKPCASGGRPLRPYDQDNFPSFLEFLLQFRCPHAASQAERVGH
jgi:hypothetical protein